MRLISGGDTWDGIGCVAPLAHVNTSHACCCRRWRRGSWWSAICVLRPRAIARCAYREGRRCGGADQALAGVLGEDRALAAE